MTLARLCQINHLFGYGCQVVIYDIQIHPLIF